MGGQPDKENQRGKRLGRHLIPYILPEEAKCKCGRPECDMGTRATHLHPKLVISWHEFRSRLERPFWIHSLCRCWYDNRYGLVARGSSPGHMHSLHMLAMAMDGHALKDDGSRMSGDELAEIARRVPTIGGIGIWENAIHWDTGSKSTWRY